MTYILANYVDFERIIIFLDLNNVEYILEDNVIAIKEELGNFVLKVVAQYIGAESLWTKEPDQECEEEMEDSKYIKIHALRIDVRDLLNGEEPEDVIYLDSDEIRQGMIMKKTNADGELRFYVATYVSMDSFEWTMHEIEQGETEKYNRLGYDIEKDVASFDDDFDTSGIVNFSEVTVEDEFEMYSFVGYFKLEFFWKILSVEQKQYRSYSREEIARIPYAFIEGKEIFKMAYTSNMPKIRFYSDNKFDAIRIFLQKIMFEETFTEFTLIIALAITQNNSDILELVQMLKMKYTKIDEEKLLTEIFENYAMFMQNNFENHYEDSYISINEFISFLIDSY